MHLKSLLPFPSLVPGISIDARRRSGFRSDLEAQGHQLRLKNDSATRDFLSSSTGLAVPSTQDLTLQQNAYIDHIRNRADAVPASTVQDLFVAGGVGDDLDAATTQSPGLHWPGNVFPVLAAIAQCAHSSNHFSIDSAVRHLVAIGIFGDITSDVALFSKACNLVFISLSWVTMLYSPMPLDGSSFCFQIDPSQSVQLHVPRLEIDTAALDVCEIVQRFGPLLPASDETEELPVAENHPEATPLQGTLDVAYLNVYALAIVGLIKIKWVDNVSCHLHFDMEGRQLLLFRIPSFCHVNQFEGSTFEKTTADYYDLYSKPEHFSAIAFFKEVRLSYRLIFGDDQKAHRYYRRLYRPDANKNGFFDPYLDELCRRASNTTDSRTIYNKTTDFPILGPRLALLQGYICRQHPNTIQMLWRDRRDLLRWYTFWAVAIIGGLGLLLSLVQMILNAIQVAQALHT
ncbi:hypothetical protein B7494_g4532 [Chlorociboria aeruginascens]|nr:hypothetical protein B7494_g4532 [Chlorociboria aeruginascens]